LLKNTEKTYNKKLSELKAIVTTYQGAVDNYRVESEFDISEYDTLVYEEMFLTQ